MEPLITYTASVDGVAYSKRHREAHPVAFLVIYSTTKGQSGPGTYSIHFSQRDAIRSQNLARSCGHRDVRIVKATPDAVGVDRLIKENRPNPDPELLKSMGLDENEIQALDRLMPMIVEAFKQNGGDIQAAFQTAHDRMLTFLLELSEGQTDRAKEAVTMIAGIVYDRIRAKQLVDQVVDR